jgi:prolyl-tRNA synthetase
MKGVPLRIEIGPKDIENNCCVSVRRNDGKKETIPLDNLVERVKTILDEIQQDMYNKALLYRNNMTYTAHDKNDLKEITDTKNGFVKAMWCGDEACEKEIKENYGIASRCIPLEQEKLADTCVCCGKPAKHLVYWGKAY